MKRIIANLLACIIIAGVGYTGPVLLAASDSKPKLTEDKVKEIALKRYSELFGEKPNENDYIIDTNVSSDSSGGEYWSINMNSQKEEYRNINIAVDGNTSTVTNISRNENYDLETNHITSLITRDEGRQIAYKFIKKVNTDKASEIKEDTSLNSYNSGFGNAYYYNYVEMVNNIPVPDNCISVAVDSRSKDIIQYSYRWNDIKFPEFKKDMGKEEAFKLFKDSFSMEPAYEVFNNNNKAKLVYVPKYKYSYIDAETGKFVDSYCKEAIDIPVKEKDITDKQKQEIIASTKSLNKKVLSKEEITKKAEEFLNKYLGKEYYVTNVGGGTRSEDNDGEELKTWFVGIRSTDKNQRDMSMEIDAKAGQLVRFDRYFDGPDKSTDKKSTKSITWEKAYDIAIEIISENYPELIDKIETKQQFMNSEFNGVPTFMFEFKRLYNNIACDIGGIDITIDNSGKLKSFDLRWNKNAKFDESKNSITLEAAKTDFLKCCDAKLIYLTYRKADGKNASVSNDKMSAKAVYSFDSPNCQFVDALNGDVLVYNGNKISINQEKNENQDDSLYGKEIQLFKDTGIVDSNDFKAGTVITKRALLRILLKLKGINEEYSSNNFPGIKLNYTDVDENDPLYNSIKAAVMIGILKNEKTKLELDKSATRLDMGILLVRFIGVDAVADKKDIFNIDYKDNDKLGDYAGYAAILKAFDVFEKSDTFDPDKQVTWEEAVHGIYKCMKYVKNI